MRYLHAWWLGLYERWRWGDGFGRTHSTDQGWNEWYDRGANVVDWFRGA